MSKYVSPCGACGLTPDIESWPVPAGVTAEGRDMFYQYVCHCGCTSKLHYRATHARGAWNEQNMIAVALARVADELGAAH